MGRGSSNTRSGSAANPSGLSGGGSNTYGGASGLYADVLYDMDSYFGFESNGEVNNWPIIRSFGGDTGEIEEFINRYTDYFVETNSGYSFDVIPKGTMDGEEDSLRKTIEIDSTTKFSDILKQLGMTQDFMGGRYY